jgi:ATP-binding cassette subfamily F protein uup
MKDVSLAFGGPNVLDKVSLSIERSMRAAITGRNGEGKSTLMKVISGIIEPDIGEIVRAPNLKVEYVGQNFDILPEESGLSGGQIRKARLEKAILSHPDLLLLDEPTNHLDIETIDWLESMVKRLKDTAVIFVTHDRRFLKNVATKILDLDRGVLSGWECDYQTFLKRKAELISDEEVFWARKEKLLAKEEAWIRRGVKARTTRNEGRVAKLMELRKEFASRRKEIGVSSIKVDTAEPGGKKVLKIKDLKFKYPNSGKELFSGFTHDILRGERIGILGANGSGKATLLKMLTQTMSPDCGSVEFGTNVKMAFLDQFRSDLDPELTVAENIASDRDEVVVGGVKKHVYSYLADFLFSPQRSRTPVKALSGGERARLMLARLFLEPSNLLILDEPTNDLDIETLELLEEQLLEYKGTLLLVSHDREFFEHVVTSTFALEGDGEVRIYPGGYESYLSQRAASKKKSQPKRENPVQQVQQAKTKLSYKEQRELDDLPDKIDMLEKKIASILSSDPLVNRDEYSAIPKMQEELDALVERWAELSSFQGC